MKWKIMHKHLAQKHFATCTHISTQIIHIPQNVEGGIFLICAIRRLALLVIMTLIHYESELEPGLCCHQGINEAEKNGPKSFMERLFRCEFQYLHITRLLLCCDIRSQYMLKLCIYSTCSFLTKSST